MDIKTVEAMRSFRVSCPGFETRATEDGADVRPWLDTTVDAPHPDGCHDDRRHGSTAAAKEPRNDPLRDRSRLGRPPQLRHFCQAWISTRLRRSEHDTNGAKAANRVRTTETHQHQRPQRNDDAKEEMRSKEVTDHAARNLAQSVSNTKRRVDAFQLRVVKSKLFFQLRPDDVPRIAMQIEEP